MPNSPLRRAAEVLRAEAAQIARAHSSRLTGAYETVWSDYPTHKRHDEMLSLAAELERMAEMRSAG